MGKCCCRNKKLLAQYQQVKKLIQRPLPTEIHKKLWKGYIKILHHRAILCQLAVMCWQFSLVTIGNRKIDLAYKNLDDDNNTYNKELSYRILPSLMWIRLIMNASRVPLFFISLWRPQISLVFFWHQITYEIFNNTVPIDYGQTEN